MFPNYNFAILENDAHIGAISVTLAPNTFVNDSAIAWASKILESSLAGLGRPSGGKASETKVFYRKRARCPSYGNPKTERAPEMPWEL